MVMPAIVARAPTRLDFGGGWTDVPPYSQEQGGYVCNIAISRYATVRLESSHLGAPPSPPHREQALADAALRLSGLADVRATISSDFPLGAGLGGSSAAGVAMMGAVELWRAMVARGGDLSALRDAVSAVPSTMNRSHLAEESRRVEVDELGIAGGRQDHYASAFGGALALSFGTSTVVRELALARATIRALEARCIVVYTGQSRMSGDTIRAVLDGYTARDPRVVMALQRMKGLAATMADALLAGDLDALGILVGEHWVHQRSLHPSITTPLIDEIITRASAAGAIGGKALGASGGGCVLLVAAQGFEEPVRRAAEELAELLPFSVDRAGFVGSASG